MTNNGTANTAVIEQPQEHTRMHSVFGNRENLMEDIPMTIEVRDRLFGSKPTNPEVYRKHVMRKTGITDEVELNRLVIKDLYEGGFIPEKEIENLTEEGASIEEILAVMPEQMVVELMQRVSDRYAKNAITGFWRDENGLYIQSYQLKGAIKEATSIVYPWKKGSPEGAWGAGKSPQNYIIERLSFQPLKIYLGVNEADGIEDITGTVSGGAAGKRSVVSRFEYVERPVFSFTIRMLRSARKEALTDERLGNLFSYMEDHGIGAARKYDKGRFDVIRFDDMISDRYNELFA